MPAEFELPAQTECNRSAGVRVRTTHVFNVGSKNVEFQNETN
jgi:hypothetical protein